MAKRQSRSSGNSAGVAIFGLLLIVGVVVKFERFLTLAERCRDFGVSTRYAGLMRDCSQLMNIPLDGYRTFVDDFVERITEMPDLMQYGRGAGDADPVLLHMDADDHLISRIAKQIRAAAKSQR